MAPEPTTIIDSGRRVSVSACRDEITCSPSMGMNGHFARPGSRGEDDVVGLVLRPVDVYAPRGREPPESGDQVDLVLVQQEPHALRHGFGHAARTRHDGFEVGAHLPCKFQSVMLRVFAVSVDLRALEQRLGRDTAPVEADASRFGALHERRLFP